MSVELWAGRVVEDELQVPVLLNDDNSAPSMYDLRVGPADAPLLAIECVGAVDRVRTETWNIGPARGPLRLNVAGDWTVTLRPDARIKGLADGLEVVLQTCEQRGLRAGVPVDWRLKRVEPEVFAQLQTLGVSFIHCWRTAGVGKVSLNMDGVGGASDTEGRSLPNWLAAFLSASERADVLQKLAASRPAECHVFLIVDFAGAPWPVESYLQGDLAILPPSGPELPSPLLGAWVVSTFNAVSLRWTGKEWKRFLARRYSREEYSGL